MKTYVALRRRAQQDEALKIRIGLAPIGELGVTQETEAAIVVRGAQENASCGRQFPQSVQALADQGASDASPLHWRCDGDGPEPIPIAGLAVDPNRGEGDMADQLAVSGYRNQGDAEGPGLAQGVYDAGFVATAERHRRERGGGELADLDRVAGTLRFNLHALGIALWDRLQRGNLSTGVLQRCGRRLCGPRWKPATPRGVRRRQGHAVVDMRER